MSINANIIATRFRVAKNFDLLVNAGIEGSVAAAIVKLHSKLSFSDVRIADDKVVIEFKTCTSKRSVEFSMAA